MRHSFRSACIGIAALAALAAGAVPVAAQINISLSIEDPAGSYHAEMSQKFADLVSEYSKGELKVVVYPGGQQGNNRESIEGMLIGTVDMVKAIEAFAPVLRDLEVFGLPYLYQSREQFMRSLDLPEVKDMMQRLEDEGIVNLAWWENGFRHMTNNARPIVRPEDLAGLKMRTPASVTRMEMFRLLGANPAPLSFTEVFTALQTGAFDGQENPMTVILTNKLFEVQKYLSLTRHVYNPQLIAISSIKWGQLNADQKAAMIRAAEEIGEEYRANGEEVDNAAIDQLRSVMEVNDVDFAAFQAALQPLYAGFGNQTLVNAILGTLK